LLDSPDLISKPLCFPQEQAGGKNPACPPTSQLTQTKKHSLPTASPDQKPAMGTAVEFSLCGVVWEDGQIWH